MNAAIIENCLVNISFSLLLSGMIIYWCNLIFPKITKLKIMGTTCILLTNISLFISLSSRWITNKYFPLSNLYESILFLTWCFTMAHIVLRQKHNEIIIGSISTPISLFTIAFASFSLPKEMQFASPLVPALRSNWLIMHVTVMMTSYATLLIGSLISIIFLCIEQYQKSKKINLQLPQSPYKTLTEYKYQNLKTSNKVKQININLLDNLDNLSYRVIGLGFPLLTIGIIAGAVWANEAWGSYWSWDPKETWALITWLIFASYLHARLNKSWKGKKPAILATVGFFTVWICYLGVNFLGKGLHSYGWLS